VNDSFARWPEKAAIFSGACFDRLCTRILRPLSRRCAEPVEAGFFAEWGWFFIEVTSDIRYYVGGTVLRKESIFLNI
jgi:hypothetical protein